MEKNSNMQEQLQKLHEHPKALLPRNQDYLVARKYCVDISSEEIFYCTYQENITTINCLSSIPSKYFHLNMFY